MFEKQVIDKKEIYKATASGAPFLHYTRCRWKRALTDISMCDVNAEFVKNAADPNFFALHHFLKCLLHALKKVLFKPTTDEGTALGQRLGNDQVAQVMIILCKNSSAAS